jgi:hypothetical protein
MTRGASGHDGTHMLSKWHSLPFFSHGEHLELELIGSHLVFFFRQLTQACSSRFLALPALVKPHGDSTTIPVAGFGRLDCSTCVLEGAPPGIFCSCGK